MVTNSSFAAGWLAMFMAVVGCDKAPSLPTVPVKGTVTYNGQPVAGAQVGFMPVDIATGKPASGVTDVQGRFTMQTFVGGSKFANGALTGDYTVTVDKKAIPASNVTEMSVDEWQKLPEEEKAKRRNSFGPAIDDNSTQAGQTAKDKVLSGPRKDPKSELPAKYADVKRSDLKRTVKSGEENDFVLDLKDD